MTRYFYYIILLTMMLNIILNIPMVLIQDRFHGAIMAMLISVLIGSLFVFIFTLALSRFPGKGLPEIFQKKIPGYIRNPYLAFLGIMWIGAGAFALISYSYVLKFYLSPNMGLNLILAFFLFVIILGAMRETDSILYLTEIIMLMATPLVAFILFKAMASKYFNFSYIWMLLFHNFWQVPSYSSVSAGTYVFIGYINMAIVNRYIDAKSVLKYLWVIPFTGLGLLSSTFFIPIGFLGIKGINDVVFPWIFITDSLRMEYGFIERVLYVILSLYLLLVLLFGIITWHIGLKLFEGMFLTKNKSKKNKPREGTNKKRKVLHALFLVSMGIVTVVFQSMTDQRTFFYIIKIWLNIRLPAEFILVVVVFFLSWRKKHEL